jgi:hypothetical protein
MRIIPDDNLAYPVLITLQTGSSGSSGSGFFLNTETDSYLVTARHVLIDESSRALRSDNAELLSYSRDPKEPTANRFRLDLAQLQSAGEMKVHASRDVAVVHMSTAVAPANGDPREAQAVPGVKVIQAAPFGIIGVARNSVKLYSDVLVANPVFLFGYPRSLGLKSLPQLDAERPLLRRGLVAGLNDSLQSIILDCPVYPGNSGGPVLEVEPQGPTQLLRVIGVVSQFVPNAETWLHTTHGYTNTTISNSGYSIAVPMDYVLELIAP